MASQKSKICLFGTSANPPTGDGGHTGIVRALSMLGVYDEIRVVPVYKHNFSSKRNSLESFHHRLSMCELSFATLERVIVSDIERTLFQRKTEGLYVPNDLSVSWTFSPFS